VVFVPRFTVSLHTGRDPAHDRVQRKKPLAGTAFSVIGVPTSKNCSHLALVERFLQASFGPETKPLFVRSSSAIPAGVLRTRRLRWGRPSRSAGRDAGAT